MALIKKIVLDNGITTNYHRVVSVNNITNQSSIIEIASYTSKAKREQEKEALKEKKPMDIYINGKSLPLEYDKNLNVDSAYEYLKLLDDFENSKDDI